MSILTCLKLKIALPIQFQLQMNEKQKQTIQQEKSKINIRIRLSPGHSQDASFKTMFYNLKPAPPLPRSST